MPGRKTIDREASVQEIAKQLEDAWNRDPATNLSTNRFIRDTTQPNAPPRRQKSVLHPGPPELITFNHITQYWELTDDPDTKPIVTMDQLFLYIAGQIKKGRYLDGVARSKDVHGVLYTDCRRISRNLPHQPIQRSRQQARGQPHNAAEATDEEEAAEMGDIDPWNIIAMQERLIGELEVENEELRQQNEALISNDFE